MLKSRTIAGVLSLLLVIAFAGCRSGRLGPVLSEMNVQPPSFLAGPIGGILSRQGDFSCHVVVSGDSQSAKPGQIFSGELLASQGKLLFAPDKSKSNPKAWRVAGALFVCDTRTGDGFLVSEALQGYAPVSAGPVLTNVMEGATQTGTAGGHACRIEQLTLESSDGAKTQVQVWRATDLNGFPVQIEISGPMPLTVTCSRERLENPDVSLFTPPGDFTKYADSNTMMSELVMRQENWRRKPVAVPPGGSMPSGPPTMPQY